MPLLFSFHKNNESEAMQKDDYAVSAYYLKKYFSSAKIQLSPDAVELVQQIIQNELDLVIDRCKSNDIKRLNASRIAFAKKWYNR